MLEIPPAKNTDAEDVVWGLQTAETLWKRGEKIDALVWLRRAAQAAGDANDDDRALELARHAAELTEWMANARDEGVDALIDVDPSATGRADRMTSIPVAFDAWASDAASTRPPPRSRAQTRPMLDLEQAQAEPPAAMESLLPGDLESEAEGRSSATSVPPAEKVHAGMFDPWADQAAPTSTPSTPFSEPETEILTSVRPQAFVRPGSDGPMSPAISASSSTAVGALAVGALPPPPKFPGAPKVPPPLPPRAKLPLPTSSAPSVVDVVTNSAPLVPTLAPPADVESSPAANVQDETSSGASAPPLAVESPPSEPTLPTSLAPITDKRRNSGHESNGLVLDDVEAFADLPDDARTAFATSAELHTLEEGEEIGTFALSYVVSGSFDVAATVVDAPAVRLRDGAVLRSRGTTEAGVPMRLICAKDRGVVATWSEALVTEAFGTCPWVEDDLRAAADRVQTLVGITIGPLGERLDVSLREEIVSRLTFRPFSPNELVVQAGEAVPGLLLVGIGELELVKDDKVMSVVGSGEFLFPSEVLGAGFAPVQARAGQGGAIVLFGDRRVAQELIVTFPPLLEVLAGM